MCLLTYFPEQIQPNRRYLLNGTIMNDDGHGYAIVANGVILWNRGMKAIEMIDEFCALREQFPNGPALFHSRFATHGETTTYNVHPFVLGGDKSTVMAHNGILPLKVQPLRGDRRSDTRITAEWFIPKQPFGPFWTRKGMKRYNAWMGPNNKIVILTTNPRYPRKSFIFNEHQGIWHEGIWYSNSGYEDWGTRTYTIGSYTGRYRHYGEDSDIQPKWRYIDGKWQKVVKDDCEICLTKETVDTIMHVCSFCNACADCGEDFTYSCMCYTPRTLDGNGQDGPNGHSYHWWEDAANSGRGDSITDVGYPPQTSATVTNVTKAVMSAEEWRKGLHTFNEPEPDICLDCEQEVDACVCGSDVDEPDETDIKPKTGDRFIDADGNLRCSKCAEPSMMCRCDNV